MKNLDTIDFYAAKLAKSCNSIITGWVFQIRALLDECEDIAEFYYRLPEIYPELDPDKITNHFNKATVASALAGMYESQVNAIPIQFAEPTADDYKTVPFDEAINFFNGKINIPTDRWDDLQDSEHDSAFVVAGAKGALLQDLRQEVEKAIIAGKSREDFKKEFADIVDRRGWNPKGGVDWRAQVIYQTNLRQAYGEGRCRQMNDPDVIKMRPYRMYVHGDSVRARPGHLALNGKVVRADDPFANQRLPNGFGCKCTWVSLNDRDLKRRGLSVSTDLRIGGKIDTPLGKVAIGPDQGFDNPCKYESQDDREKRKQKDKQAVLDRMPADISRDAVREIAGVVFGTAAVTALTGLALAPVPIGFIAKATEDLSKDETNNLYLIGAGIAGVAGAASIPISIGTEEAIAKTIPLGLYLPSVVPSEISKEVRSRFHEQIAEEIKKDIRPETIQEVIDNLADTSNIDTLTIVIGGAGDDRARSSNFLAQRLKKQGLEGEVIATANSIETSGDNIFERSFLQVYIKSLELTPDSVKALLGIIAQRKIGRVNFVTHSAGSAIAEDIAGVMASMGISVNNVITLGGITTPPKLLPTTKYRRYISDADEYQILNTPFPLKE